MKENWEYIAAMAALVMTAWGQLKTWSTWVKGLAIRTCWLDSSTVAHVIAYLDRGRARPASTPIYGTWNVHVRPLGRHAHVAREHRTQGTRRMWHRGCPIWVQKDKDSPHEEYRYRLNYIRGTVDVEALIMAATEWENKTNSNSVTSKVTRHAVTYHHGSSLTDGMLEQEKKERQYEDTYGSCYRFLGWKNSDIGRAIHAQKLTSLALPAELARLADLVRTWVTSKEWYQRRGIPHRRGFLLHGQPGTGKTSFVRALAEEHDLPVHVMDIATMNNSELRKEWGKAVSDAPCIVLIEDIDAVFAGRKNVSVTSLSSGGGLTYDALLNCIDGVERQDGILVFITTNHLSRVDEALTDRPGRIDHVVEFLPIKAPQRREIAARILGDSVVTREFADSHPDCPAAVFVEACCRRALEELYEREREQLSAPPARELRREVRGK